MIKFSCDEDNIIIREVFAFNYEQNKPLFIIGNIVGISPLIKGIKIRFNGELKSESIIQNHVFALFDRKKATANFLLDEQNYWIVDLNKCIVF